MRKQTMTLVFTGTDQGSDWGINGEAIDISSEEISLGSFTKHPNVTIGSIPVYAYHNGDWNHAKTYHPFHNIDGINIESAQQYVMFNLEIPSLFFQFTCICSILRTGTHNISRRVILVIMDLSRRLNGSRNV